MLEIHLVQLVIVLLVLGIPELSYLLNMPPWIQRNLQYPLFRIPKRVWGVYCTNVTPRCHMAKQFVIQGERRKEGVFHLFKEK